jgi:hypothetical protein
MKRCRAEGAEHFRVVCQCAGAANNLMIVAAR